MFNEALRELSEFEITPENPDAEDLIKARIEEFHKICKIMEMTPLLEGLSLCFGVQKDKVLEWANGKGWNQKITKLWQQELSFLTSCLMSTTAEGQMDKVSMIYMTKNHYGYKNEDQQPLTLKLEIGRTPDQLIEESKNLLPNK